MIKMYTNEIMDVHEKLKSLRDTIREQVAHINTIYTMDEIDDATNAIFGSVLVWMEDNTEDIKFK